MGARRRHALEAKLDAVGYGFFIPVFFVTSGMSLDLRSIIESPARLIVFFLLFLVVRGLPALLFYRHQLPMRGRIQMMLLTATALPLLVALSEIGLESGTMLPENAAALVGAGVLSVVVYPASPSPSAGRPRSPRRGSRRTLTDDRDQDGDPAGGADASPGIISAGEPSDRRSVLLGSTVRSSRADAAARLNAPIASLFVVGSACFVLGSVPAYVTTVGGRRRRGHLLRRLSLLHLCVVPAAPAGTGPAMTDIERGTQDDPVPLRVWRWLPHDRNWLAAVTQFPGTLFFNVSTRLRWHATPVCSSRIGTCGGPTSSVRPCSSWPARSGSSRSAACGASGLARCRGGSPGSTWSDRSCSWPLLWPASSCPARVRWSASGSRSPGPCSAPCAS